MTRQPATEACDVWLSTGACILAVDAAAGIPARAWLDGSVVILARASELSALGPLAEEALASIRLGASAVVEFGPAGPEREIPIELSAPAP